MTTRSRLRVLVPPPLARQTGIYTASQLASRAVPFLLLPIMTRYLSPTDYGIVAMFLLVAMVLEPFVGLGLAGAVTVRFFDRGSDLARFISTGLVIVACASLVILAIVAVFREPLSEVTAVPPAWLLLVVPLVVARVVGAVPLALLRVEERPVPFGVAQNALTAGTLSLALVLVVGAGAGWVGRVGAELIAWVAFAVAGVAWLHRRGWLRAYVDRPNATALARFGVPLIPHMLGSVLVLHVDRLLLTNMVGVDETGLYTVGYQLALVVELVAVSFNNAYAPWLYRRLADADDAVRRSLVRATYAGFAGMALLAVAVAVVMPLVGRLLLDPRYAASGDFVPWFAVGLMFSGMYYLVTNYIFYAQRTAWLAAATTVTAVVNVALTYLLISANGAMGAAQAMALSFGLSFILTWIASSRAYPMPWLGRVRPSDGRFAP